MEHRKMIVGFCVTIALLTVLAGIAIVGINAVMEPFTSYDFTGIDADSKDMLLQMYTTLRTTRFAIVVMLALSIAVKSVQFAGSAKAHKSEQ